MKWFSNLKLAAKLISGFIIVALIAGVVGLFGIKQMNAIDAKDQELYELATVPLGEMGDISTAFQRMRVNIREMILAMDETAVNHQINNYNERKKEIAEIMPEFEKTILTKEGEEAYKSFKAYLDTFYLEVDKVITLVKAGNNDEALELIAEDTPAGIAARDVQDIIAELVQLKNNIAKNRSEENSAMASQASLVMMIVIIAGVVVAILLGILLSQSVSRPVAKLVAVADKIANNDLDVDIEINSKDEIGLLARAFKNAAENINEALINIDTASDQVASGARQVADSSIALSQGATEQASSIEELTASIEEIAAQTEANAKNADQTNELAQEIQANATTGNEQMKEMLKAMEEINVSSGNISRIIKVIDEIAFQTNILALNAAVEAARAGQHGKGFAVVAEEVRNLAARSANAAKETTDMIEGSIRKVEDGTKIANDTATALNKIVEGVFKTGNIVHDIAVASNEQSLGLNQINQGIMQVSQVVQTNSATSEESAAASEELSSQAELLKQQVNRFKLKKSGRSYYWHTGESNLESITKADAMGLKKKEEEYCLEQNDGDTALSRTRIALSDAEFGKY